MATRFKGLKVKVAPYNSVVEIELPPGARSPDQLFHLSILSEHPGLLIR
jgi:hypothetical protein